jgi:molecular chaperone HtpG
MAILVPPPEDFRKLKLYELLCANSSPSDGAAERTEVFVQAATPLVDLIIAGPFREFTLHNHDHCKKILHLAEYLIPSSTLDSLTVLDCQVLIFAAYLHDMGMVLTASERDQMIASPAFYQAAREWQEVWNELTRARARLNRADEQSRWRIETRLFQLQEAVLTKLLRVRHATAERYRDVIALLKKVAKRPDLFEFRGVSFEEYLIDICVSHNQDVGVLAEVKGLYDDRFPRDALVGGERLNTQFCAAVLRLADIMDFDRERTPKVLFESLGLASRSIPGWDISLSEWQKHLAVHSIEFTEHDIVIAADSRHPVIQHAIIVFAAEIEREVRDTLAVLRRNPQVVLQRYSIEVPVRVRPQIRALGYVYKEMALGLNQTAVMSLLMGERLYSDPAVALRELIQNSLDACTVRSKIDGPNFEVRISIDSFIDESERRWIRVSDNGIGMDEHVLSEYFLKLGNSYYQSPEFERVYSQVNDGRTFNPISRFGIGIASVFMIGDVLEVRTRAARSPRLDNRERTVRVERMGSFAFVTETTGDFVGTTVCIRLRAEFQERYADFAIAVSSYLQERVLRPRFPIHLWLSHPITLTSPPPLRLKPGAREILYARDIEAFFIELAEWSKRLSGCVVVIFGRRSDGRLLHELNGKPIRFGSGSGEDGALVDASMLLDGYAGNRVTVNGFRMNAKRISRIAGFGDVRIPMAFDVEVVGDSEIEYDITRDRIVGRGRITVAKELREAIQAGLDHLGVLARLAEDTKDALDRSFRVYTRDDFDSYRIGRWLGRAKRAGVVDEALLSATEARLPRGQWPKGLHKTVAKQLGISHNLASRAISSLIELGRVKQPV